ncbi:CRISPR-associated endoribonuclease Cas6 [Pyrococcus yayanosii]|uniref:Genomic islands and the ecology and n=1 Tax=Pyrococcus yayanosii (strain CH1 / JCM 16557) TaxID=529709 RepID=F8AG02_PYRYC|nr:CRISPR-associated endoribonuclease Cas6 [Pyrococcus yayanosii]AEH25056.1 Genomic islands and the ecology and [Pyrococcus yayanosii CH1]
MRIEIKLLPLKEQAVLPFNYNYEVYFQLVEKVRTIEPDVAELMSSSRDLWTFSRIIVRNRRVIPDRGIEILSDDVSLYISSSNEDIIRAIAEAVEKSPEIHVGNITFLVSKVRVLKMPKIGKENTFSTLSPIVVRTVKFDEGRLKHWDLYPHDELFIDKLRKTMLLRYTEINGHMPEDKDFKIETIRFKPTRLMVGGSYVRGSLMVFRYIGSREIAEFAYDNGFGEKTRFGFGMVKLIE